MSYARSPDQIPSDAQFVIFTGASVCIPGDERSRQSPGHGYPEHTENYLKCQFFSEADEWKKQIRQYVIGKTPFKAFRIQPTTISVDVNVQID